MTAIASPYRRWPAMALLLLAAASLGLPVPATATEGVIEELVVTSQRREQPRRLHAGNIDKLDESTLNRVQHQHMHELLTRVAGAWLSRGSGQEHLTAIRSPVLTGAGSCGAFLFLEDGIPIRPAGFCNVNSLFEINTEQARSIEVIRGPGNALYGSNALHGIVNVLQPFPRQPRTPMLAAEAGANEFLRLRAQLPFAVDAPWLATLVHTDDGGFRDASGYRQDKLHAKFDWPFLRGEFTAALSLTDLDQETAGFILGRNSYRDPELKRSNPNPEAFRDANSARAYGIWTRALPGVTLDFRPYLRRSAMEFLQHFLPGQPLEENGHDSAGVISSATLSGERHDTTLGIDLEWSDMYLRQAQDAPTAGSDFLRETRPAGQHYDFAVRGLGIAAYLQTQLQLSPRLTLGGGLRVEYLHYDYDNRMLDGNTRDDGTACGFGGCLYSRPADRSDSFTDLAPKLSLAYRPGDRGQYYASLAQGFRAPQANELYRLQSGQQLAELDSERIDSLELGYRYLSQTLAADVAVFAMNKRGSVFRDAEGFNVSGARTRHRGIEFSIDWQLATALLLSLDASYARHSYDFDTVAAQGETFRRGRDVDTAPRWLGSAEVLLTPAAGVDLGLQLTSIGNYFLDAENRFRYPGHVVGNLRGSFALGNRTRITLRLNNIMDRNIADRADYAFGNYRYFPGRGREFFAEIQYLPRSESL